ncbi:quinone oxidoreductase-like protein 2 homolog [Orbicella faveolata]|uniref:quinone oxidoreductase-like protein 2 homolog n=1 Tax=Orbicella faveolata TaxID=48498 RepID=UPI0009E5865C|nr:quinone oxidoreductase-like protein 2 homolog [Orbicella faveolata]
MAAFRTVPERLLRPVARALSARNSDFLASKATLGRPRMYRAALCKELGKPLVVEQVPAVEKLKASQVRVAVHSCGINFADILMCLGKYQEKPPLPFTPGNEIAGVVIETGEGVKQLSKGDRVFGLAALGGFAEECIVEQSGLWKIPSNIEYNQASAFAVSYGTAYVGLTNKSNTQPGQTVLVTAAAGALGLATVDIAANALGAKVIGAASKDKLDVVTSMGASATIDYNKESIKDKVKELTGGKGANVIMEAVGGQVFTECLRCIAWGGVILPVGFASGDIPQIPANVLLVKNCSAAGLFWGSHMKHNPALLKESVDKSLELLVQGKLKGPHISGEFELDQANEAFKFVMQRKSTGKVLIKTR